jgi:N-acetylmuramoyl-L-alanine amidase
MAIVVIDPGHGGTTETGGSSPNNAQGPTGLLEKNVTLDLARRVRKQLQAAGIDARLTRDSDVNLGLQARAKVAMQAGADAFVSIHLNGYNGKAQGTETWQHTSASQDSAALATLVQAGVRKATGLDDRGVKSSGFGVLRPDYHAASTAACLVEVSFMDVADEEARLKTDAYKDKIATALAGAIRGWLVADGRMAQPERMAARSSRNGSGALPEDGYEAERRGAIHAPRTDRSGRIDLISRTGRTGHDATAAHRPAASADEPSLAVGFFADPRAQANQRGRRQGPRRHAAWLAQRQVETGGRRGTTGDHHRPRRIAGRGLPRPAGPPAPGRRDRADRGGRLRGPPGCLERYRLPGGTEHPAHQPSRPQFGGGGGNGGSGVRL